MLREMEYVHAVYEEGSFSKAAKKLYVSQPALSAIIRKLERKLRSDLFDRRTSPVKLTQAGEYYISSIERIMSIQREMDEYFSSLSQSKAERITIASPSYFCIYILSPLVREFQELRANVSVTFTENTSYGLSNNLRDDDVDFVFDIMNPNEKAFSGIVWGYEHIVVAVPKSFAVNEGLKEYRMTAGDICDGCHLDAKRRGVDMKVFERESFLLLKKGNDIYKRVMDICRKSGFTPEVSMYLDQLLTCYHIACSGKGIACVRDSITRYVEQTDKLYFYKIDDPLAVRAIKLYHKNEFPMSSAARDFFDFVKGRSNCDA